MKTQRTLLLIALFAAGSALAQQQMTQGLTTPRHKVSAPAATTAVGELKFHWLAPAKPADLQNDREPVEGLSPQAWTTIVGWHPSESAFPDENTAEPEMPLLWFGREPWQ
jgi:hypothetical protein